MITTTFKKKFKKKDNLILHDRYGYVLKRNMSEGEEEGVGGVQTPSYQSGVMGLDTRQIITIHSLFNFEAAN